MLFRLLGPSLVVHTPAKLNLFLEVLGKRDDGFHELETLMVSVGLYDTLTFTEINADIQLTCSDSITTDPDSDELPLDDQNLIVRAAKHLRNTTGTTKGVRISLTKRIPVAAGLAGGSSDAASTLVALNRLWQLGLSITDLHALGAELGSDINFFMNPTPAAICRGRGEIIEPLSIPLNLHFVVARPSSGLSTVEVFQHCQPAAKPRSIDPLVSALRQGEMGSVGGSLFNRLQEPAESLSGDVRTLNSALRQLPLEGHLMSGSGTSCFGVCSNRRTANRLARQLHAQHIPYVFAVQLQL